MCSYIYVLLFSRTCFFSPFFLLPLLTFLLAPPPRAAASPPCRVYNIHVYEGCGRRNGAVDVVVTAGSKSSSPPPPSPPSPSPLMSDVESRTNIFSPLVSQVPKLFSRVFPLPVSSTTGDSGIGCCGNSDNTGGSGGSDAGASGSDGDDNGDKDVQADLSFFAYNPWTVEGQAAAQALLDGPWV